MEDFTLPVFNIEVGDVSDDDVIAPTSAAEERTAAWRPRNVLVNLASRSLQLPRSALGVERNIQVTAEECLIQKDLEELNCTLPGNPRSTFLMAFSPDGTKIASTHGDHNINVTDLRTGNCIRSLVGHPRTPWCLAFHPHHNDILASGCLGGQVRVWDLHGGSEVWSVTLNEATSVIASLSFHPTERLLVIATNNSVYFWDWNLPQPFAKCNTASEREKLRYVRFEPTGQWLITGIANAPGSSSYAHRAATATPAAASTFGMSMHVQAEQERERNLQSRYQTLLDQYERLRRRYQELRHRAAELEYHANNSSPSSATAGASSVEEPGTAGTSAAEPPPPAEADAGELDANSPGSSTDVFWRTLMQAAQSLRTLSSIGRTLGPSRLLSSEASTSREPPPFDRDARIRIRMMSRHIENMQRICRVHLEVTQHRRQQVYRLQQIRRILEDLQEQIRYLHVCVRDSLDLMAQSRPASSSVAANTVAAAPEDAPGPSTSAQPPVGLDPQSFPAAEAAPVDLDNAAVERAVDAADSNLFSRRRLPLRRPSEFLWSPSESQRFVLHRSQTTDPAEQESYGESESGGPDRSGTFASSYSRWRRLRFSRFSQRLAAVHGSGISNNPAQQRRRITRAFLDQPNPNDELVNATQEESRRLTATQHSLRPLMERLESHFRLQRQTMGVLSDLSSQGSRTVEPEATDAPSDANNNQSSPNWSGEMFQGIRDGRSRESSERMRSLSASRVSPYQRSFLRFRSTGLSAGAAGNTTGTESASRNPLLLVSDDSSDTDNDVAANPTESQNDPPNAVGGSSGTVVRRMRLLWNEYLSQVVLPRRVLNYNVDESSRERRQYRLWLSMMVDSLTSFFSQHGIHAEQNQPDNSATNAPNQERPAEQESRPFPMWRGFQRGAAADPPTHRWDLRRNAESQVSLAAHLSISHRIQAWNFSQGDIPDISDTRANIVVAESRIHNDASVDISSNGLFLAALLPSDSPMGALISLHSLEAARLGSCLAQVSVAQCVVSVSLSPTNRHLLLGLATSRALSVGLMRDHAAPVLWAQVYKIPAESRIRSEQERKLPEEKVSVAPLLEHVRDIGQQGDPSPISLNCMRWIPVAGQGFALGTNKGHLKLLR